MATRATDLPAFPARRTDPFDIPAEYSRLREEQPVSRVRLEDGNEPWLVTGYRQAREVLGSRRFSSDPDKPGFPQSFPASIRRDGRAFRTLIRMDPPEHTHYRRMLSPEFVVARVEAMRPEIQAIADGLLDEMARGDKPADLVQAFALPLPSLVIWELLGVPKIDRPRFESVSLQLITTAGAPDRFVKVVDQLKGYMEDVLARKRAAPADDLLSRILEHEDAGDMDHDTVVDLARLLLLAGHLTTANMISLGVLMLIQNPTQAAELRADPTLAPAAVEELLRHQTLIQGGIRRACVEDTEVGGRLIRAGEGVIVLISAANRDDALGGGEEFDIHRGARGHLAFGYGFHQCLGQLLARVELDVALVTIARRFPTLALAVPMDEVGFRDDGFLHGVRKLPVTW